MLTRLAGDQQRCSVAWKCCGDHRLAEAEGRADEGGEENHGRHG
jgi:hypothetical protein